MSKIAIRWSGLALTTGAALLAAAVVVVVFAGSAGNPRAPLPPLANLFLFLSSILLLLSLPAMYARQADAAGWLGLVGHALLQTGILELVVVSSPPLVFSSFNLPFEENVAGFLLGIAFTLGLLLTGIATLRANVFPKWAGILLLGATVSFFLSFFIAELLAPFVGDQFVGAFMGILLGLPFAWIGLFMWKGQA